MRTSVSEWSQHAGVAYSGSFSVAWPAAASHTQAWRLATGRMRNAVVRTRQLYAQLTGFMQLAGGDD